MSETAIWSLISIAVGVILTPLVVQGLEVARRRYDAAQHLLHLLEPMHGQLRGIESIVYDARRNLFTSMGPRAVLGQLAEMEKLFADYDAVRLRILPDLRSRRFQDAVEKAVMAAKGERAFFRKLAEPYLDGRRAWDSPDHGVIAYVNSHRDFLRVHTGILNYPIPRLRRIGATEIKLFFWNGALAVFRGPWLGVVLSLQVRARA